MRCLPGNPAQKRYLYRFISAMTFYVAFIFLASYLVHYHHPSGAMGYTIAVLPAIPIVTILIVVGLYLIEETDEFEKTVVIQSMLWAIGATLALTTVWGFLELFSSIPHLQPYLDFPIFWGFVGIATPIVRRRYR